MSKYLLDTHAWVWLIQDDRKLSDENGRLMEEARASLNLYVSVISVWEVSLLVRQGRLRLDRSLDDWFNLSFAGGLMQMAELTREVAVESTRLPGEFHRDPADRFLAATARVEDLILLTRDNALLSYARQGYLRTHRI